MLPNAVSDDSDGVAGRYILSTVPAGFGASFLEYRQPWLYCIGRQSCWTCTVIERVYVVSTVSRVRPVLALG